MNIIANVTDVEARMMAYSLSFGVHIRTSKEAEVFLGISAMSTDGGTEQLQTFYSSFADPETVHSPLLGR
ncbi:hypothetical protein ACFX5Q_00995 [Mesorhizobium sp. IMUNJ 23033]|uniref:hypothetical protein n=1 Tax=Mesorhizobium sp. IMUNJ 23033 TaxID=3378039 RepID=UPI003850E41F